MPKARSLAMAAVLAAASATAVMTPATAAAAPRLTPQVTFDRLDPAHELKIEVTAHGTEVIGGIEARLINRQSGVQYATVGDFKLVSGDSRNGVWRAAYPVDIDAHPGVTRVQVSAIDLPGRVDAYFNACYESGFTDLRATPGTVDIDHRDVTVRGRFLFQKSRDTTLEPAQGVEIVDSSTRVRATTSADGAFTLSTQVGSAVGIGAESLNSPVCADGSTVPITVNAQRSEVTEARLITPAGSVVAGREVVVEGRAVRQSASGLVPAEGAYAAVLVASDGGGASEIASGAVQADGTFRVAFPAPRSGKVSVRVQEGLFLTPSSRDVGALTVVHPTHFEGFGIRQSASEYVELTGKLLRAEAGGTSAVAQAKVQVEWSADGTKWASADKAVTLADGGFSTWTYAPKDGFWRVRYSGSAEQPGTVTPAKWLHVAKRFRTAISSFNASPEPVRKGRALTVQGRLTRLVAGWKPGAGAQVYVYFRAKGTSKWTRMAVVKTGPSGWFQRKFKASKDGTWMAGYKGSTTYRGASSVGDYVDVR